MKSAALFASNTVLLALVVAACGGGGGKPLTKAEFLDRGDAICRTYRAKNQELNVQAPARGPTDPQATDAEVKQSGPILEKLSDNLKDQIDELDELNPPADVASDWANTLDDLARIADGLHDAAAAAVEVDRQRIVNLYGEILRLDRRVDHFATDYGFRVCGIS